MSDNTILPITPPANVVSKSYFSSYEKYMELYKILTGKDFIPSSGDVSNRIQNNIKNAGF